jgi:orotidine-5'-phosphate decarboxylase
MTQTFREKWLEAVERKNSVVCLGLDPADFLMQRGDEGLPEGVDKFEWSINYIKAGAPYAAAVKPNLQYWKNNFGMRALHELTIISHELGLVVIDDSKLADIGSTNDAGMYHTQNKKMDAITLACFAGNIKEAAEQCKKRELGGIHMCLMSNPEYAREKNKWVEVKATDYDAGDIKFIDDIPHVKQYQQLAHDAKEFSLEGVVIGAPSKKNHITEQELSKARMYTGNQMLVLLPGVGAQGGEAGAIWKYFANNHVIVNVGRAMMFPKGSNSTSAQQAEAAKYYQEMLNSLRAAA